MTRHRHHLNRLYRLDGSVYADCTCGATRGPHVDTDAAVGALLDHCNAAAATGER